MVLKMNIFEKPNKYRILSKKVVKSKRETTWLVICPDPKKAMTIGIWVKWPLCHCNSLELPCTSIASML